MTNQPLSLRNGVPLESEYKTLLGSDEFSRMESFSNSFLANNEETLRSYAKRWVSDPLHQWSRQWEYPFVNDRIMRLHQREDLCVLDAGSGATFFPYYLIHQFPQAIVECCDYDRSLQTLYEQFNRTQQANVNFSVADLRSLPYEDQSVDVVYCISVLEHTNAYDAIVSEFFRVLRPGGKLIVTFDISLDGKHDIPAEKATELLALLIDKVEVNEADYPAIAAELDRPSLVSTCALMDSAPELLPWKKPGPVEHLKSLIKSGRPKPWPIDLTFYCADVDKVPAS